MAHCVVRRLRIRIQSMWRYGYCYRFSGSSYLPRRYEDHPHLDRLCADVSPHLVVGVLIICLRFYVAPGKGLGEPLTSWSLLQLIGFVMLIYGELLYDEIVKLPFGLHEKEPVSAFRSFKGDFIFLVGFGTTSSSERTSYGVSSRTKAGPWNPFQQGETTIIAERC